MGVVAFVRLVTPAGGRLSQHVSAGRRIRIDDRRRETCRGQSFVRVAQEGLGGVAGTDDPERPAFAEQREGARHFKPGVGNRRGVPGCAGSVTLEDQRPAVLGFGGDRRATVHQARHGPWDRTCERRVRFRVDTPARAVVYEQPAGIASAFALALGVRNPVGDDRLRACERDRCEARPGDFRGECFLAPALAVAEDYAGLAHHVTTAWVVGIERHTQQVAAEVDGCRRVWFPKSRLPAPKPHRGLRVLGSGFANGICPVRTGPGHRSQSRGCATPPGCQQAFGHPALVRHVTGNLALVAHGECLTGERRDRSPRLWRDRRECVPKRHGIGGELAGHRVQREVHGQFFVSEPAFAWFGECGTEASADVWLPASKRQHASEGRAFKAQADTFEQSSDHALAEPLRIRRVSPRKAAP